eukprot:1909767-Prymnesium_polylepis.1
MWRGTLRLVAYRTVPVHDSGLASLCIVDVVERGECDGSPRATTHILYRTRARARRAVRLRGWVSQMSPRSAQKRKLRPPVAGSDFKSCLAYA